MRALEGLRHPRPAFLLAAVCVLAATVPCDAAPGRGIRFERLSIEDGLSQGTVTDILQDRTGFLWLATQDGLNRFDGRGFHVVLNEPDNPASLGGNWINTLLESPSGDIWIGTAGAGLNRWSRTSDEFERFPHDPQDPDSLAGGHVRALMFDPRGSLWVGTESSGLDRFDPASGIFTHFRHDPTDPASLSDNRVRSLRRDREGRIWVGTAGGLNLFDPQTETFRRWRHDPADPASLPADNVRAIHEDAQGGLWLATHGGLAIIDTQDWTFTRFAHDPTDPGSLSSNRVVCMVEDGRGRLWVGTERGLNLFDRAAGTFTHYLHDPAGSSSLSNNRVASLAVDRTGILWVGTHGGGLNKWDPRSWAFTNDPVDTIELGSSDVHALALDDRQRLWIGTSGGGLSRIDRRSGGLRRFRHDPGDPGSLSDDRVTALLVDGGGTLWAGTLVAGLNRLDPGAESFVRYAHDPTDGSSVGHNGIMSLFEDRDGRLWVGTFGGGLNRLDRARGTFRRWRHDPEDPNSLGSDMVSVIAQAADGRLWLGTFNGGLHLFDPEGEAITRFLHDPEDPASLSNDTIMSLHLDRGGRLWVGTPTGLNRLDHLDEATGKATFRRYLERDGLPNEVVYGILSDNRGRLWISTNRGLSRHDPATGEFRSYDASHGLQSDEFNLSAHFAAADGELFFGGIRGLNSFFPESIPDNPPPPVVLTGFSKFNRPARLSRPVFEVDQIALDHTDNLISFEFAALDFAAPANNRYRYRLDGFSRQWVDLGTGNRATFTNLDPGRYTLRVQAANNDGVWNEEGLALGILIPPPFWQTWWFRALLATVTVGLVLLIIALRTRAIRRRNELLQALVTERTLELEEAQGQLLRRERLAVLGELAGSVAHELRNPLGAIKNSAYFLRLTHQDGNAKTREHLALIDREIDRSNGIITELLDYGRSPKPRPRRTTLQEIVEAALAAVRMPEEIVLERRAADRPIPVEVDPDQIERILINLVRNAVQAMRDGGTLTVDCSEVDGKAVAAVADTGPGIPDEHLRRIFEPLFTGKAKGIGLGLAVSLRYANLNRGAIEVESELGRGATFRLTLPLAPE